MLRSCRCERKLLCHGVVPEDVNTGRQKNQRYSFSAEVNLSMHLTKAGSVVTTAAAVGVQHWHLAHPGAYILSGKEEESLWP